MSFVTKNINNYDLDFKYLMNDPQIYYGQLCGPNNLLYINEYTERQRTLAQFIRSA